ncbi:MAG TPA: DUF423 domain-containing protein, partial [Halothiobacillaceae bacterium]|nr:DUF423 domain-containing protein [Halothiobacillaceae bacterium]
VLYQRGVTVIDANQRALIAALILVGVGLFSGSIYLEVLLGVGVLSALTPIGGLVLFSFWGYWLWLSWAVK